MDIAYEIFDIIVALYGVWGIVLMLSVLVFFTMQIAYYIFNYGKIVKYRDTQRPEIRTSTPTVSVIVPLFTDDYPFLDDRLPLFMAQEGVDFEVVIVYVGSNSDFYDDLEMLREMLPNVTTTKIESNPRFPISIKTALNVGIKAASNECLIFTTADCYPTNEKWLALMASGFKRGNLVLGYTSLQKEAGVGRYLMRISRMMGAANWISRAIKGRAYRGERTNIGWTKSLYYSAKGFSHLNMNIGEDDLFVQRLLESSPAVSVILSPRATLVQICWGGVSWWSEQYRFFRSSFSLYPSSAKRFERWEPRSRLLLFGCAVAAIVLLPLEIKIAAAALLLIRAIIVVATIKKTAKRLGEKGMALNYWIYDLLSPLHTISTDISLKLHRDPKVWR